MIRLLPLGGANEIGGSCTVVEAHDLLLVIDCGIRPKSTASRYPALDLIPRAPDAVLVTHAHADHTGGLPILHRRYPGVPMYATSATLHVTQTMLRDSVSIQERDWEGEVDFTQEDVDAVMRSGVPVPFDVPRVVARSATTRVTARFVRAGHILGAAMIALEIEHRPSQTLERVLFSGDVSLFTQPTIPGGDLERIRDFGPTVFVCEGTYGIERHRDIETQEALFAQKVASVLQRGGRVLIPSFAIGRAQNVALVLRDAMRYPNKIRKLLGDPSFQMPRVPIYLDGLCRSVSDHYAAFPQLLHRSLANDPHPLYDRRTIFPVATAAERARLLQGAAPAVFVASSGMLTGGASVVYAQQLAQEPKSAIFLVGYQDEESPGAMLFRLTRARQKAADTGEDVLVPLGDAAVPIRCDVEMYGMSAHADSADITTLVAAAAPERVALVHGSPLRLTQLAEALHDAVPEGAFVARTGEWIPVQRRVPLRVPRAAPTLEWDHWRTQELTGRLLHRRFEIAAATPYITAALTTGPAQGLTDSEVARADALAPDDSPRPVAAVVRARRATASAQGLLWETQFAGREAVHRPVGPVEAAALAPISEQAARRTRELFSRTMRGLHDMEREWGRVRRLAIQPNDLILFLDIGDRVLRLTLGLVVAELKTGYTVVAPAAADTTIVPHQVIERVGPWPSLSGAVGVATPAELRLLQRLGDAVPSLVADVSLARDQGIDPARPVAVDPAVLELYTRAWILERDGQLSPEAARLVTSLLMEYGAPSAVYTSQALADRIGGAGAGVSPAVVHVALRELVAHGLLAVDDTDDGLRPRWVGATEVGGAAADRLTDAGRVALVAASDPLLDAIGPGFTRLLRGAVVRAAKGLEQRGTPTRDGVLAWGAHPIGKALLEAVSSAGALGAGWRRPGQALPALPSRARPTGGRDGREGGHTGRPDPSDTGRTEGRRRGEVPGGGDRRIAG